MDTSYRRLVINEVLAVNKATLKRGNAFPDMVELYYDGPTALSLSGMSLSDDPQQPAQFVFPAGTTMNPGQYLVLYADTGASDADLHLGFGLNADGDAVYLYDKLGRAGRFGRVRPATGRSVHRPGRSPGAVAI